MRQHIIAVAIMAMSCTMTAYAQTDRTSVLSVAEHNGWEYEVKAGVKYWWCFSASYACRNQRDK